MLWCKEGFRGSGCEEQVEFVIQLTNHVKTQNELSAYRSVHPTKVILVQQQNPILMARRKEQRSIDTTNHLTSIKHIDGTLGHSHPHTSVLGLPGKEIHERGKWLSYKTEAHPENHVTCNLALDPFDLLK